MAIAVTECLGDYKMVTAIVPFDMKKNKDGKSKARPSKDVGKKKKEGGFSMIKPCKNPSKKKASTN